MLDSLSEYLETKECSVSELAFDSINLSNLNYLCCVTPNTKVNKLWLRFCQLKDKGINNLLTVLDETNRKTQISLLHLDCNGITCEGAKKIAKVLRTNRSLHSLSLARNAIKVEGALALVNVLSKFHLDDNEIKWVSVHEQQNTRLIEYLMDVITVKLEEKQRTYLSNSNDTMIPSIEGENLKQKARSLFVPPSHPYLAGQLLRSGLSLHCPGNFKLAYLNISYNRFSPNILSAIKEQLFQYQQKICLAGEGIKVFKIENFELKQVEKQVEEKRRHESRSAAKFR